MIAVKYNEELSFKYPKKIRRVKKGASLPEGYDEILTQEKYDEMVLSNQSAFDAVQAAQTKEISEDIEHIKFKNITDKVEVLISKYKRKGKLKKYSDYADMLPKIPASITGQDKKDLEAEITKLLKKEL